MFVPVFVCFQSYTQQLITARQRLIFYLESSTFGLDSLHVLLLLLPAAVFSFEHTTTTTAVVVVYFNGRLLFGRVEYFIFQLVAAFDVIN